MKITMAKKYKYRKIWEDIVNEQDEYKKKAKFFTLKQMFACKHDSSIPVSMCLICKKFLCFSCAAQLHNPLQCPSCSSKPIVAHSTNCPHKLLYEKNFHVKSFHLQNHCPICSICKFKICPICALIYFQSNKIFCKFCREYKDCLSPSLTKPAIDSFYSQMHPPLASSCHKLFDLQKREDILQFQTAIIGKIIYFIYQDKLFQYNIASESLAIVENIPPNLLSVFASFPHFLYCFSKGKNYPKYKMFKYSIFEGSWGEEANLSICGTPRFAEFNMRYIIAYTQYDSFIYDTFDPESGWSQSKFFCAKTLTQTSPNEMLSQDKRGIVRRVVFYSEKISEVFNRKEKTELVCFYKNMYFFNNGTLLEVKHSLLP